MSMVVAKEVEAVFDTQGQYFKGARGIRFHPNGSVLEATLNGASQDDVKRLMEYFGSDSGEYEYPPKTEHTA